MIKRGSQIAKAIFQGQIGDIRVEGCKQLVCVENRNRAYWKEEGVARYNTIFLFKLLNTSLKILTILLVFALGVDNFT